MQNKDKLTLALAMLIFGTIGVFRKGIALPSDVIACLRGLIGAGVLFIGVRLTGGHFSREAIRRNRGVLILSGALIGFNWMLLFEAYRYTSLAVATLMYYMAPVFVILASAALFKQRLSRVKALCVLAAVVGMVLVSGVILTGIPERGEIAGILFGLGAAALYAVIMLLNGRMRDVGAYDRTVVQLFVAGAVLIPYVLLTGSLKGIQVDTTSVALLLVVCVVHTGIAYAMYFGGLARLDVQTVALYSYIDPVTAVLLSAVLPNETLTPMAAVGAALILGATLVSEKWG